ncbi:MULTISPECIES: hypothetical protein [Vibrio]|uniref:Uncharacterized protein n=1 Tax=Vibrio tasmaniensis TaxID=212663 RepID=A0A2N7NNB5_9VIBR|nr:hypothetical protein [Vibrio tasmaniensis]PMO80333.1 hypothetical protein BCT01_08560 [Vibrio tasmaniensis]PMP17799.1 hypothetical protein BCS92_05170 [Vibrio tasmaniensis]TKG29004.1 hypothetical protein FC057_20170 [Vibrio tasmaniensis]TKG41597.1 hypothetical protein FC063_06980 [Vibrio tasmaniensis]TKG46246.1 hypothetical protein FC070_22445 [Vibrio tasmaniensis]
MKNITQETNKKSVLLALITAGIVVTSPSAFAATGIEVIGTNIVRVIAFFVGIAFIISIGVGAMKWLSVGYSLDKLKGPQQDPNASKDIGIDFLKGLCLIGAPALIVMFIVSFFGTTEVINFMMGGEKGLSTSDMLNLNQGQTTK